MLEHDYESYRQYKREMYKKYVRSLCVRYTNQVVAPPDDIERHIEEIKPLIAKLVSCIYNLAKELSHLEMNQICYDMVTLNKKDFCTTLYDKYQNTRQSEKYRRPDILLHALLLRDFYTSDFEKISLGGNFCPLLFNITDCYLKDRPYQPLSEFIYFPVEEVPFTSNAIIDCFISRCKDAVIPASFNKAIFERMVHEDLEEVVDSVYTLFGKDNDIENDMPKLPQSNPKNEVAREQIPPPYSWGRHLGVKDQDRLAKLDRKKVAFSDDPTPIAQASTIDGNNTFTASDKKKNEKKR